MAVSPEQIASWARGIGLAQCVGEEFVHQFGRLPQSLDELNNWGNSTGRRSPNGSWTCKGSTGGGGGGSSVTAPPVGSIGGGSDLINQVINFVKANPIPSAIVAYLLLRRR